MGMCREHMGAYDVQEVLDDNMLFERAQRAAATAQECG